MAAAGAAPVRLSQAIPRRTSPATPIQAPAGQHELASSGTVKLGSLCLRFSLLCNFLDASVFPLRALLLYCF